MLIGPGYLTKGYKTIVNGQVVQTTDGRTYEVPDTSVTASNAPATSTAPPPPRGNWPEVVTIIDGDIVDPETKQSVTNLPSEIELIPIGLRKISTGEGQAETMVPFFRVKVKAGASMPAQQAPATNRHPASIAPEGPDFSGLLAAQEAADETTEAEAPTDNAKTEEKKSGGLFDFLFGSEEEEEVGENEVVIDLNKPLTAAEMEALKQSPEFQRYLQQEAESNTRNFYSSKNRGKRISAPKPPEKIVVEKFNPEDWVEEAPINPTPNMSIGKLVSVDMDREIAVCWLQTRYIRANMPMVTRNYELETTGVLLPSGEQDGRSAGFWVAQGKPNPGDEVIVPGPDYLSLVEPWLEKPQAQ